MPTLTDPLNGRPQPDPDAHLNPPDGAWADGWERELPSFASLPALAPASTCPRRGTTAPCSRPECRSW